MKIEKFDGEYRWLSNFYMCKCRYEGIVYPSSEHAYQAAKTLDQEKRIYISELPTPGQAKRCGNHEISLRDDWDDVKLQVMEDCLRSKFSNKELADKLIATEGHGLSEGNTWNDVFWGKDLATGYGENNLGKLLMKIREGLIFDSI